MRKILMALLLALPAVANAGTISVQVTEGGQPNATKTYNIADAQIDRIVAAHQSDANVAINGTATRAQVLNYWVQQFINATISKVQNFETPAPVIPAPINPN